MIRKFSLYLAMLFIFTIPWETAVTISSLGTLSRLIGLGTAGLWMVSVFIEGRLRKISKFQIALLLFLLYNIASFFWTISFSLTQQRVITYLQLAILSWIFWDLFSTSKILKQALQIFILGGYVSVVSAIINFISGTLISATEVGRYSGAGQNAVEFAVILSISLPIAWYLVITQKSNRWAMFWKAVNVAFIPAALFAIILTASRTALICILPGLFYFLATFNRVRLIYRILMFCGGLCIVIFGQALLPQATIERLETIGGSIASNDLGGRGEIWGRTLMVFQEHPLLGIGGGALDAPEQLGTVAHNTFLSILTELGVLGFFIFCSILFIVMLSALIHPGSQKLFWMVVFASWIIGVLSLTWEYTKTTWFIWNMIVISAEAYSGEKTRTQGLNDDLVSKSGINPDSTEFQSQLIG